MAQKNRIEKEGLDMGDLIQKLVATVVGEEPAYTEFSKFKHIVDSALAKRHELLEAMIANFIRETGIPLERLALCEKRNGGTTFWFIQEVPKTITRE